ncbi:MAG: glycoside hydrolase [Fluviicola sp. XM-24bin1]|nr:MAG: glycoside hydrolase [Fluviicola sp. XM-24bin1]
MRKETFFAAIIAVVTVFASCDKEGEGGGDVELPTNIATSITITEGQVDVQVTAQNANFYTVTFNENGQETTVESTDGAATYTFSNSGTYQVKSRAHVTHDDYIEKIDEVTVVVDNSVLGQIPTTGYETPMTHPGYTLVWNDEFDGTSLSSDWVHETGNGQAQGIPGWGNNELQYYQDDNTEVVGGYCIITAKQESQSGFNYTSSRIKTQGMQSFQKGRIDIRAALPQGKGIWPALWMLGDNISSVGWPACGEIDIMEMIGGPGNDQTIYGTVHWSDQGSHAEYGNSSTLGSGIYADEFHVFSIIWDDTQIRWLRDDVEFNVINITGSELTEFHQNFFMIFNIAVGGNWPGSPDASTQFPQRMAVDYVRVFQ